MLLENLCAHICFNKQRLLENDGDEEPLHLLLSLK